MNATEFEEIALALVARGFSPLPIAPDQRPSLDDRNVPEGKAPGFRRPDGTWGLMTGWQKWGCEQVPATLVRAWCRMIGTAEDAGVGVALGRGLICIDIDQEYLLDPVLAILPPSPVQKKGRKGVSLFYRGNTEKIRSRNYRTDERIGLLDLLSEGKQTILPPSIHPDTNEPYYWWGDLTLCDVPLSELPELPDDIADQIGEVLKPFGYDPDRDRAEMAVAPSNQTAGGGSQFYRELNNDALANLCVWVPHLGLRRLYRAGGGFKAVCEWRNSGTGRAFALRAPNLSFTCRGIRDFGDGRGYSALDVVMEALRLELDLAVEWLGERLGYDFSEAELVNGPKTLERIRARDHQNLQNRK